MYERFVVVVQTPEVKERIDDYLLKTMNSYIDQLTTILDNIENKFPERMDSIEDKVCSIYQTVKDTFINSKNVMQNEFELDLPDEIKRTLSARRLKLGAQQFEVRKQLHVAQTKIPLHECFEDKSAMLDSAKDELDEKIETVVSTLKAPSFQSRLSSVATLKSTIRFNIKFLSNTLMEVIRRKEGFEDVSSYADMQLPFSMTSVTARQKGCVDSIREAMLVIRTIQSTTQQDGSIDRDYAAQNNLWDAIERKKQELQNKSEEESKQEIEKYKEKQAKEANK
jgi:hypothetical protein